MLQRSRFRSSWTASNTSAAVGEPLEVASDVQLGIEVVSRERRRRPAELGERCDRRAAYPRPGPSGGVEIVAAARFDFT